jgi:tetratricopeptide (TPR) repeat protein
MLRRSALPLLIAFVLPVELCAESDWPVAHAPIQFKIDLLERPSHSSAGYFIVLPDGGILPKPFPETHVMDADGKLFNSYTLWHNSQGGLAIVFEDPGPGRDITIYVAGVQILNKWTASSGLTPSPLLCVNHGSSDIGSATKLLRFGIVDSKTRFWRNPGHPAAPLSIGGDISGRPRPASFYLLAYLVTGDPGKTWITPFSGSEVSGQADDKVVVKIDNKKINPKKRSGQWGGIGQYMHLDKGLHRLDVLAACRGKEMWGGSGVMWLGWATPNAKASELGGPRPDHAPFKGDTVWACRMLQQAEIASSGSASVREIRSRDGGPVAHFEAKALETYWLGTGRPLYAFSLKASTKGNPENTQYRWQVGKADNVSGPKHLWILHGEEEYDVTLTATSGKKESIATIPVFAFSSNASDLNSASMRSTFRAAFVDTIRGYPVTVDPTTSWDDNTWNCFFDVQGLDENQALLSEVMTRRWRFFKDKIPADKLDDLQDIFFNWISFYDPQSAIAWIKKATGTATGSNRRSEFHVMNAEVYMYHIKNYERARKILEPLATGVGDLAALAAVRLGDIAFLEGDLSQASKYWGAVQNRVQITKDFVNQGDVTWEVESENETEPPGSGHSPRRSGGSRVPRVDEWKKAPVLDSNISSGVRSLMDQGYYIEALSELRRWEKSFPLSKISGDYIVQEARFLAATGNRQRARVTLNAYCDNIEASSYLADAAEQLVNLMLEDKESDEVLRKFYEDMKNRFDFHPFGERLDALLGDIVP